MSSLADAPVATDARATLRTAGIVGLGAALPPGVVANEEIACRVGVDAGWIAKRTGIRSRRRAAPGTRVVDLAVQAARQALADAEVPAGAIDTVLVATLAPDDVTPNAAPQVAHELGARAAAAADIGAACTGFVSALTLGAGLIEARRSECALVIGAEILSRHTDFDDRATAGLFGDGAGAVVLQPGSEGVVGASVLGSDGAAAPFITAPRATGMLRMDGHETFRRAVAALTANARAALAANELTVNEVGLFVFHQANGRITRAVAETLDLPPERVVDAIADTGNTSAASIPLALAEARASGRLLRGDRVLLGAVGAGFTWGATVVRWGTS